MTDNDGWGEVFDWMLEQGHIVTLEDGSMMMVKQEGEM